MKSTTELMQELSFHENIDGFLEKNNDSLDKQSFFEYLNLLAAQKKTSKSKIIKASQINQVYGYQIFAGTRVPGKDKIIAIALSMKLNIDETQRLLKLACAPVLYPKNSRDCIIIDSINKGTDVTELNSILYEYGLDCLK